MTLLVEERGCQFLIRLDAILSMSLRINYQLLQILNDLSNEPYLLKQIKNLNSVILPE